MALLASRLGPPATDSFNVWARFDASTTVRLDTRLPEETAWTLGTPATTDASKYETIVLTKSGLTAGTRYEWRLVDTGTDTTLVTSYTYTQNSTRVIAYLGFDFHISGPAEYNFWTESLGMALADYEANYEPLGIPPLFITTGDWTDISPSPWTKDNHVATFLYPYTALNEALANPDAKRLLNTMPVLYMHDDWDWGGNNASQDWGDWLDEGGNLTDRYAVWDVYWRDYPQPAAPSFGYKATAGGTPFIMLDMRSQKLVGAATGGTGEAPIYNGPETYGAGVLLGSAQMAWAKSEIDAALRAEPFVFVVSPTTMATPIVDRSDAAMDNISVCRDGASTYYSGAVEELFESADNAGCNWRRNLYFLSGDDHGNRIYKDSIRWRYDISDTRTGGAREWAKRMQIPFYEFKNSCSVNYLPNLGEAVFGPGNVFNSRTDLLSDEGNGIKQMYTRLDIRKPTKYMHVHYYSTGNDLQNNPAVGKTYDCYFSHGNFLLSDPDDQKYPPSQGQAPGIGERWYVDDVDGHMMPESRAVRDDDDRLRDIETIEPTPDRDTLLEDWVPRTEEELPEP